MRYFKVMVQLGHMGNGKSRETFLYIRANSILKAMSIAKKTPAVKHSLLPLSIQEITREEYIAGRKEDPYIQAMDQLNNGVK